MDLFETCVGRRQLVVVVLTGQRGDCSYADVLPCVYGVPWTSCIIEYEPVWRIRKVLDRERSNRIPKHMREGDSYSGVASFAELPSIEYMGTMRRFVRAV